LVEKQIPLTVEQVEKLLGFPAERMPKHIAVIPDGNGRWAQAKNQDRINGHREGINSVRRTVRECRRLGVKFLTIYAFSTENWKRPKDEVEALWELLKHYVSQELPELQANGVRLNVIGRFERLPEDVQREVTHSIDQTKNNSDMVLTIALSYSGRDELVLAMERFGKDIADGKQSPGSISEENFSQYLETHDLPDPDLLIRTSGEMRISNFLLWQLAYAEIYITETLWPDFSTEKLHQALKDYVGRQRRFGRTGDQLAPKS
jgi:undecaprenyl diphosphate synthase